MTAKLIEKNDYLHFPLMNIEYTWKKYPVEYNANLKITLFTTHIDHVCSRQNSWHAYDNARGNLSRFANA